MHLRPPEICTSVAITSPNGGSSSGLMTPLRGSTPMLREEGEEQQADQDELNPRHCLDLRPSSAQLEVRHINIFHGRRSVMPISLPCRVRARANPSHLAILGELEDVAVDSASAMLVGISSISAISRTASARFFGSAGTRHAVERVERLLHQLRLIP